MESTARWLVCAGPDEFLFIASALVAAGDAGAIEWEPDPARAYVRAACTASTDGPNVVVGACTKEAAPEEVACTLAGMAGGVTVLCAQGARLRVERGPARSYELVEPGALLRFLLRMGCQGGGGRQSAAGIPEGVRQNGGYVGDDLEEPAAFTWADAPCGANAAGDGPWNGAGASEAARLQGDGAPGCAEPAGLPGGSDASAGDPAVLSVGVARPMVGSGCTPPACPGECTAPIRAMGRLPRTGIDGNPRTARPAGGPPNPPRAEASRGDGPDTVPPCPQPATALPQAPASASPYPASPGRVVAGVATEPVAYRPLVGLPELECAAAGAEGHVPTICFASPRGGVGKTALAVLTALALARDGLSVALIDLDFQFGTCLGYLGADETDGLMDIGVLPEQVRLDARTLARCRTTPERGLAAYEFCRAPEQAEALAGMAACLVRTVRVGADVAVVDLPTGVSEVVAQVLDMADRCLLVSDQRAFALESLASLQSLCARLGVARTKLVTVMNRCDPRHRDEGFLSRVQFEAQTPQIARVVDGGLEVMQMLAIGSAGELLAMRNRFALSTADLAHALCADLGCRSAVPAASPRLAPSPSAPVAHPARGVFRRHRKERRGEQVPCPF